MQALGKEARGMRRLVVNVSTGRYVKGQERLTESLALYGEDYKIWRDAYPPGSPTHEEMPYAFKARALWDALKKDCSLLLWADASIVALKPLQPIWDYAQEHGVWMADNGWNNAEWTADSAYPILFPTQELEDARNLNRQIRHVVATTFAIDAGNVTGYNFLMEYLHYAGTGCFKGPWKNTPETPCGPSETLGHRHDQSAASVIAWRLGIPLTQSPKFFTDYPQQTEETILIRKAIP